MAKTTKKKETVVVTRAEKKDATKNIIKDLLAVKPYKHNELIDEVAKIYTERFAGEDTENVNDVKGRVGSVLDIMKKESDVMYDGGMYALKARLPIPAPAEKEEGKTEEKPAKKTARARTKKSEKTEEVKAEEVKEEIPAPKKAARKTKAKAVKEEKKEEEKTTPLPAGPLQPIAPVAPITPEVAPEPVPDRTEEAPAPKKRGRKAKAKTPVTEEKTADPKPEEKPAEKPAETADPIPTPVPSEIPKPLEIKDEPKTEETRPEPPTPELKNPPVVKEKAEVAKKNVVMDMSFLFGDVKGGKAEIKAVEPKPAPAPVQKTSVKAEQPKENKPAPKAERLQESKPAPKAEQPKSEPVKTERKAEEKRESTRGRNVRKTAERPLTADEKLRENFLKRMRALGGDYFEYYSVYLLERYSMKNGRRLESMRICGGDHDGGIDGEIELTDKFGFKETIYIQAKNWDPDKGDEKLWVVGETLLQQFIGACACKQAKDGKQHCRGIFITTSRFTPDAKHILETMSDKIVGYDGADLYEAAKECEFGMVKKNGEWSPDEKLLSGTKAFFNML